MPKIEQKDSYPFKPEGVTKQFNHRERKRRVHNRPPYKLINRVVGCVHLYKVSFTSSFPFSMDLILNVN